jgi:hypothetical protein
LAYLILALGVWERIVSLVSTWKFEVVTTPFLITPGRLPSAFHVANGLTLAPYMGRKADGNGAFESVYRGQKKSKIT